MISALLTWLFRSQPTPTIAFTRDGEFLRIVVQVVVPTTIVYEDGRRKAMLPGDELHLSMRYK